MRGSIFFWTNFWIKWTNFIFVWFLRFWCMVDFFNLHFSWGVLKVYEMRIISNLFARGKIYLVKLSYKQTKSSQKCKLVQKLPPDGSFNTIGPTKLMIYFLKHCSNGLPCFRYIDEMKNHFSENSKCQTNILSFSVFIKRNELIFNRPCKTVKWLIRFDHLYRTT